MGQLAGGLEFWLAIKLEMSKLHHLLFFSHPVQDWHLPRTPYEIMSQVQIGVKQANLLDF